MEGNAMRHLQGARDRGDGGHAGHAGRSAHEARAVDRVEEIPGVARPIEHHADEHAGLRSHDQHAGHSVAMFRDRLWLSVVLTVPVLTWSAMIQEWLGFRAPSFPLSDRIPAIVGTIVFLYGGAPFLRGGVREIRDRRPGMMLLITLAIVVALVASAASEGGWLDLEFWWELTLLIDVMLLGHWQEMKALGQASEALDALAALLPDDAEIVDHRETRRVPVREVRVGDLVLVRPGARVPADGVIEEGEASFDESMITGESRSVGRVVGDRVVAGTVATDSGVRVRVTAIGEGTALAGIRRLVRAAQDSRSRAQALADRAAALLFYVAVGAGVVTFVVWTLLGDFDAAVERTITVLVISCPHALGLAIPLVIAISTSVSARAGILVKDRLALERMRTVDAVLFDKTGTLTRGRPAMLGVVATNVERNDDVLALAAAVEQESEHPLAQAVVERARRDGVIPRSSDFRSMPGRGVRAVVEGSDVAVGGPALLREAGLEAPPELRDRIAAWEDRGATVLSVVRDGKVVGSLALEDEIRPESVEAVRELHDDGVRVVMITGDARNVADAVARDVGVDEVIAEVLPEDKDAAVADLQRRGLRTAMVGDGVN
ncbi:MAG TPA: heavy metal translocating P-type ATPase, partial [Actinomycetota bacterium]|nr:heavy metal translocating P-type ATPase [Actinomycetota bacterium]